MKKIIAVVGATASGKSAVAVEIAKKINSEIISCDSMQIYKGMNIGTAKVTNEEMCGIKHHLIDFVDVGEAYSVSDYVTDANNAVTKIFAKGMTPIFAGGTGLYLRSFLYDINFTENSKDDKIKKELELEIENGKVLELYEELKMLDPKAALNIHPNNHKRLVRALEYIKLTGEPFSEQSVISIPKYEHILIYLDYKDRQKLYDRINLRVDIMMEQGLLEEAKFYQDKKLDTSGQAIGYKELFPYFNSEISLEESIENIKRETRRYAKRQTTWFKAQENIRRIYVDENSKDEVIEKAISIAKEFLGEE